jgi:thiol:disulfide interchange protein DsbD
MAYVRAIRFVTSLLLAFWLFPAAAGPKSADQAFKFSVALGEEEGLELNWSIEPGYYLYRNKIVATLNGKPLRVTTAHGETKDDPTFGLTEIYHHGATAYVETVPETGEVLVTYQGCGENTICYPPATKAIDLATLAVSDASERVDRARASSVPENVGVPSAFTVADDSAASGALNLDDSYGSTLLTFLGLGLLLAFTPCMFPMLPILSGILTRSADRLSLVRSLSLSAAYVLAMASAYGVLGIFAAWFGGNLQAVLQTPVAIGLMSVLFVALALSMFGFYELQLPQSLTAKLSPGADRTGSIGGAALLGFTSALIVGPCVTPPLAGALLYVAQTGDTLRGSSALFAFGLGMGLPLILLGTFGGTVLPKSGPWLIRIRQAFGIVFLGAAIWMMSRLLPLSLIAASWGVFALGAGVWLGYSVLSRSGPAWSWPRATPVAIASALMLYGGALVIGAIDDWYEPLRPLAFAGIAPSINALGEEQNGFQLVTNEADLNAAIANGQDDGRPVLIDFSADWCTECRLMERTVFADATVRDRLNGLRLIRADMTRYDAASRKLMERFAVVGPPTLIFLSPAGAEVDGTRIVGTTAVDDFLTKIAAAERG